MRICYLLLMLAVVALCVVPAGTVSAQCVTGTSVAELQVSGPFAGLYKYTVTFNWTTAQGLSNITLDCGFGACPEEACDETYEFDPVAGQSTGEGGCTADYEGEFNCNGNPSIGLTDPIIKWDAVGSCEPENTGSGTFCFYTNLGPSPESQLPIILIKNGQNVCQGTITGDCPTAPCAVPVEESNLGRVKHRFH